MTFKEKSTWVHLVTTIIIFGFYFSKTFTVFFSSKTVDPNLFNLFISAVILLIIIEIILHIILGILFYKQSEKGEDERDNLIELKATKVSYFILVLGVWITAASIIKITSPFILANIIMAFFILAEIVGWSIQLFHYRRGI